MREPLVSIIIPIYNGEKYIKECLESIKARKFQDYEVILVNDGSTDGSLLLCEQAAGRDERIRIFTTENCGVSHARNYGIRQAAGQWILFLDCDDYLLEDALDRLAEVLDQDCEEVCANYLTVGVEHLERGSASVPAADVIAAILDPVNEVKLPKFYHLESATLLGIWGKLFSRKLILEKGIFFDEKLRLSEDMLFHISYLQNIDRVYLSNEPVFYYRQHEASVTRNFKKENVANRLYLFEELEKRGVEDPVFTVSTMLQLACQAEQSVKGEERRILERQIAEFFQKKQHLLKAASKRQISAGRWQEKAYQISVRLFLAGNSGLAFLFLRIYSKIR